MEFIVSGAASALWLGILTSISPCPLVTNIAAISFISKQVHSVKNVLLSGLLYTIGRMITYAVVAFLVIAGLMAIPKLSHFLQKYMNMILGPALVLTGMFLLELISINMPFPGSGERAKTFAEKGNLWSACLLGILFALSFCPVTAAIFFGSLIPLSIKYNSDIILPSLFGLGTGLPVFLFAVVIAVSAKSINIIYKKVAVIELWARRITGVLLILIGIYLSLDHIFEIL
ncbi:aromatic aminobenezylarsenical efflux permease ArsG family transporter [candidate division KSB1 bacterium]